jgi:hypothetical protein
VVAPIVAPGADRPFGGGTNAIDIAPDDHIRRVVGFWSV